MLHGQFAPEYLVRPPGTPWSNTGGTHFHVAAERLINFSGIPTYEQYLYTFSISKTEMMMRGRLEQRWIQDDGTKFSQRARIFISGQIPLFTDTTFSKGVYAGIQNELFLNISNKQNVNGYIFDQNRAFLSLGYRWSKAVDTEIGYMYWYQSESEDTFMRNVLQFQVTTSF